MTANTPDIALKSCASSQIHAHGHCPITNRLHIQFKSKAGPGSVYEYPNVTAEQYAEFCKAESLGKHFGQHIKGNAKHPHRLVSKA